MTSEISASSFTASLAVLGRVANIELRGFCDLRKESFKRGYYLLGIVNAESGPALRRLLFLDPER